MGKAGPTPGEFTIVASGLVPSLSAASLLPILGMQSSSMKLFSSSEQKAMLLKRQAFAVFSGELDQYHLYLPLIQGKTAGRLARPVLPGQVGANWSTPALSSGDWKCLRK